MSQRDSLVRVDRVRQGIEKSIEFLNGPIALFERKEALFCFFDVVFVIGHFFQMREEGFSQ
jgi:hypothetical protein